MAEIPNALTHAQWAGLFTGDDTGDVFVSSPSGAVGVVLEYKTFLHLLNPHGTAALCLYGQPFGFTREDVATLREMAESPDNARMERYLNGLADRLAVLLPTQAEP